MRRIEKGFKILQKQKNIRLHLPMKKNKLHFFNIKFYDIMSIAKRILR